MTGIGRRAFVGASFMGYLVLGNCTVGSIGVNAFEGAYINDAFLMSESTVGSIGQAAFQGISLGEGAFTGSASRVQFDLRGSTVGSIGEGAFYACSLLSGAFNASGASFPRMDSATSPGRISVLAKTSRETTHMVTNPIARRRKIRPVTKRLPCPRGWAALLSSCPIYASLGSTRKA